MAGHDSHAGPDFSGPLPPLTPEQTALRDELRADVENLRPAYTVSDTPAQMDFDAMARVVDGLEKVVAELAR